MDSKNRNFEEVNVRFETTYEEQHAMPDSFRVVPMHFLSLGVC